MKVIIVEDEFLAQQELSWLIKEHSQMEIVGTFDDGLDVLKYLQHNRVDAIFLDINIPSLDGVLLAQNISQFAHKPFIVFITAWKEHAVEAFELEAFDYILKPYQESRIINMLQEGFSVEPMVAFMENLMSNPSTRAVNELYGFLEKNQLPITPDGHFLAYKKVRETYMDIHSDTMLNKPQYLLTAYEKARLPYTERGVTAEIVNGETVLSMERNRVDDNKDRTCSEGLHFCGMSYLTHFGNSTTNRIVVLKINPADVVSIPSDYNDAKGRTCRYVVLSDLNVSPEDAFKAPVQTDAVGSSAPTPVAQEYDSRGRPLSMTPGAIRKRQLRAAAKAANVKATQITDSWPAPKKR